MEKMLYDEFGRLVWKQDVSPGSKISIREQTFAQQEYMRERSSISKWEPQKGFGKIYVDMIEYIYQEISPTEWMFFTRLMRLTCFKDCVLRRGGNTQGAALNNYNSIAEELHENYQYVRRNMLGLISHQMIIVSYTGSDDLGNKIAVYRMNPYLFFRGSEIQNSVIKEFQGCKWAKYNELILGGKN